MMKYFSKFYTIIYILYTLYHSSYGENYYQRTFTNIYGVNNCSKINPQNVSMTQCVLRCNRKKLQGLMNISQDGTRIETCHCCHPVEVSHEEENIHSQFQTFTEIEV